MSAEKMPLYITPQEYLQAEEAAATKSEYHNGVITAMAGGDPDHNRLTFDTGFALALQLSDAACEVFTSEQRVSVPRYNRYFYPDVVVACEEPQFENIQGVRSMQNPVLIVEVLSASTEREDRSSKFVCYQTLSSLQVYVLVSQHKPLVETFTRELDGAWRHDQYEGLDAIVSLPVLGCELRLAAVYKRITFPPQLQDTGDIDGREADKQVMDKGVP